MRFQQKGPVGSGVSRRIFLAGTAVALIGEVLPSRLLSRPVAAKAKAPKEIQIVEFSESGQRLEKVTVQTVVKSDAEWKQTLSAEAYEVTRRGGTERPYTGKYRDLHEKGLYHCICCGIVNFSSETKFESGTGWPSFWQPIAKENVREVLDASLGTVRKAISCPRCEAHLGHVFDDGPRPTGLRYCMNSVALDFKKLA